MTDKECAILADAIRDARLMEAPWSGAVWLDVLLSFCAACCPSFDPERFIDHVQRESVERKP